MKTLRLIFLLTATAHSSVWATPEAGVDALQAYSRSLSGERREAAEFLLEHLPDQDSESLALELFEENLEQAFIARETYPWTQALPKELFFNDVLPHAVVTEKRDPWRKRLRELLHPKVVDSANLLDAYEAVGSHLKELTGVDYNTRREKACQSPAESMRQGMASCTGLSILAVDALRAVGLPARLAGIPLWGTKEGNHTWIEVHDGERWRFSGYGGTPDQWDQGWEIERCAYCDPADPIHSIFATSYRTTSIGFPTAWEWRRSRNGSPYTEERDTHDTLTSLVWNQQPVTVPGIDRTTYYLELAGGRKLPIPKGKACIAVRANLKGDTNRIGVPVRLRRQDEVLFEGRTASEAQDLNDYIRLIVEPGEYSLEHQIADGTWESRSITSTADEKTTVQLELTEAQADTPPDRE